MKNLFTYLFLLILLSCNNKNFTTIELVSGDIIKVKLAITEQEQLQGLSGIKDHQLNFDEGMLFVYKTSGLRRFWMPDTYFDLDIFFLDKNFIVLEIDRDIKHHIGRNNPEQIPTTRTIYARHVLELKSSSELSKKIKIGDKLKLDADLNLEQIE